MELKISVLAGANEGAVKVFNNFPISIGRLPDSDLQLLDSFVSRRHCAIYQDNSTLTVSDLKSDVKFYKKRIIQLTKNMMKGEHVTNSVNKAYNEYMKSCVAYLKFLDTKDILQEEYKGIPEQLDMSDADIDGDPNNNLINPTYLHKQNKIEDYLDVKKISNVPKKETYLPEKKDLKLKEPE